MQERQHFYAAKQAYTFHNLTDSLTGRPLATFTYSSTSRPQIKKLLLKNLSYFNQGAQNTKLNHLSRQEDYFLNLQAYDSKTSFRKYSSFLLGSRKQEMESNKRNGNCFFPAFDKENFFCKCFLFLKQ